MIMDTTTNRLGGTYVVTSAFGWCQDRNPFRAFMKLADRSYVTGSFPKAKDRKAVVKSLPTDEMALNKIAHLFVIHVANNLDDT